MQEVGGSIPPGSTNNVVFHRDARIMNKMGRILMWVGAVITAVGLVVGFSTMFAGNNALAKYFLMFIPVGFLLVFTGLVTVVLSGPERQE